MVTSPSAINLMANNFLLLTNQAEESSCSPTRDIGTYRALTTKARVSPSSSGLEQSSQISTVRTMCRSSSIPINSKSRANNMVEEETIRGREATSSHRLQLGSEGALESKKKMKRSREENRVVKRGRLLSWTPARSDLLEKWTTGEHFSLATLLSLKKNANSFSWHSVCTATLIGIIVLSLCTGSQGARINQYGGYEDVVVSVSNEVPPITCQQLIQNLQGIFTSASEYLSGATRGRAYFHRIVVVLPPSWDSRACGKMLPVGYHTSASSIADADFRIGAEHPIFGHLPFTQQSQGCTKPGDFISVGYQYILQYNDTEMGPSVPDRAFVHEWTKYRYGVFEEIGFENDTIYPQSYLEASGNGRRTEDERKATSCTNRPLKGSWSGSCNSNDPTGNNCVFVPSLTDNADITSSIMSHPHLPHVRTFCDSSTHNRIAPTKQNFLCDKKSVFEIMNLHPDFHNSTSSPRNGRGVTPEFVVKQLTQPRFVLLVEETGNMNLRDVWKYMKLAIRKFIKYDLPTGTQIGLMTVNTDIRILANMTGLDDSLRGTLADKLPNYPSIDSSGSLSLRKGISQAINMLKWNGQRVAGSVIVLISQGTISPMDLEASLHLLRQEEVSIATIEYPSIGDGKISTLSQGTNSPHFAIRETGVGTMSHMSTYIQLVNAMMEIQRFYTKGIAPRWPVLIHQEEFKGDAPSFVESSFSFDASQTPGEFYIYIPNPIDPKVNKVELTSPSGTKFTDQLSLAHDINVIKIDAVIDQPGIWRYKIQRLGDSHQSHFVQVLTNEYLVGSSGANEEFNVRLYSNVDTTRSVNLSQKPLILYADVKRGSSPVLEADVEALILAGTVKWSVKLFDNGNGDADLTRGDGIYSRYIIPPASIQNSLLDITVRVSTSPYRSKFIGHDSSSFGRKTTGPCCGSALTPSSPSALKIMPFNERVVASYIIKISNPRTSEVYRPSRIGDLRVLSNYDTTVGISFTAPGDDYDQGMVQTFQVYYTRNLDTTPVLKEQFTNKDAQAGATVNVTLGLPNYGLFYLTVVAVDPYGISGQHSNVARVKTMTPPAEPYGGSSQSQLHNAAKSNDNDDKLGSLEIVFIAIGCLAFLILLILIIVCCYRRRRNSKGMGSTETKISTISDTKAPIHWSASELLQEHEKRQSIYAQTQPANGTAHHGQHQNYGYSEKSVTVQQQTFNVYMGSNGSPGSSTRSFRSISENNRKTSVDSSRRPTLTDYESCSSDPTVKSLKGPTDYDTPVESDQENYRTIDSYAGGPYRLSNNFVSRGMQSTNSGSHMQYNPNIQGSLTSVNSKRRNITMV